MTPSDLQQPVLLSLLGAGFVTAFLHAALPTHWLPFVLVGKAQRWSLAIHGGAGVIERDKLSAEQERAIRADLDPDAAALMVGSLLLGLSVQCLVDPDIDLDPIRETSLAMLRLSFAAQPQPDPTA